MGATMGPIVGAVEPRLRTFRLFQTPSNAKRHCVFDGGHVLPRLQEVARETLDWLDQCLGPVRTTGEP